MVSNGLCKPREIVMRYLIYLSMELYLVIKIGENTMNGAKKRLGQLKIDLCRMSSTSLFITLVWNSGIHLILLYVLGITLTKLEKYPIQLLE